MRDLTLTVRVFDSMIVLCVRELTWDHPNGELRSKVVETAANLIRLIGARLVIDAKYGVYRCPTRDS